MANASIHIGVGKVDPEQYRPVVLDPLIGPKGDREYMATLARRIAGVDSPVVLPGDVKWDAVRHEVLSAAASMTDGLCIISFSGHGTPSANGSQQGWCLRDRILTRSELLEWISTFQSGVRVLVVADCCYAAPQGGLFGFLMRRLGLDQRAAVVKCVPRKYWGLISKSRAGAATRRAFAVRSESVSRCALLWFAACAEEEKTRDGNPRSVFTSKLEAYCRRRVDWTYEELCGVIAYALTNIQKPSCRLVATGTPAIQWGTASKVFR